MSTFKDSQSAMYFLLHITCIKTASKSEAGFVKKKNEQKMLQQKLLQQWQVQLLIEHW